MKLFRPKIFGTVTVVALSLAAVAPASAATVSNDILKGLPNGISSACESLGCSIAKNADGDAILTVNSDFSAQAQGVKKSLKKMWRKRYVRKRTAKGLETDRQSWRRFKSRKVARWEDKNTASFVLDGDDATIAAFIQNNVLSAPVITFDGDDGGMGGDPSVVPLPAGAFLLGGGLVLMGGLGAARRRKAKA